MKHLKRICATAALTAVTLGAVSLVPAQDDQKPWRVDGVRVTGVDLEAGTVTADHKGKKVTVQLEEKVTMTGVTPIKMEEIKSGAPVYVIGKVSEDETSIKPRSVVMMFPNSNPKAAVTKDRVTGKAVVEGTNLSVAVNGQNVKVDTSGKFWVNKYAHFKKEDLKKGSLINLIGYEKDGKYFCKNIWVHGI